MRLSLSLLFTLILLVGCGPQERAERDLAQQVRERWLLAERESDYQEVLSSDLWALHESNMRILRPSIPTGYPEPYLPYGKLQDRNLDPALTQTPALDADRIALGRKLFVDTRLSYSQAHGFDAGISCSSCHEAERFFTDGKAQSQGVEGDLTPRSAPSLINAAYLSTLTWGNPTFPILEMQALIPLFNDDPIEMGLRGREQDLVTELLEKDPGYGALFSKAFAVKPDDIDYTFITAALASYERSLIRFDTRFDRFMQGMDELSETELKGLKLFYDLEPLASGDHLPCGQCHSGFLMTNSFHYVREAVYYNRKSFHNTGMYNLDGRGAYPPKNSGFANAALLAKNPSLMGQFRVPPLRFIAGTAPYGHDGSLPDLAAVLDHYAAGGRSSRTEFGQNPYIDPILKAGFTMNEDEKKAVISFLQSLQ